MEKDSVVSQKYTYRYRMIVFPLIICLCFFTPIKSQQVRAYTLQGSYIQNKTASFRWGNTSSAITTAWNSALNSWATASSANIYNSTYSSNILTSYIALSSPKYGELVYDNAGGYYILQFTGYINMAITANQTNATVRQSTACHEIGHLLGLDDLTSGTAIMNVNRTRTAIYTPKQDDKNGVSAVYS